MGTTQLLFVFLSFILFGYLVMIANQRDELYLIESAKEEMFDNMVKIGDLANDYYLNNTDTTTSEPSVLEIIYFGWGSPVWKEGTVALQTGTTYTVQITGLVLGLASPYQYFDPYYYSSDGNNWTKQIQTQTGPQSYRKRYIVGAAPDVSSYNPNHTYTWTVEGAGSPLAFEVNSHTTSHPTNNMFTVVLSTPGNGTPTEVNSYSGFSPPAYLINRPYCDIEYSIINDTLIHFTGSLQFEPGVVYERQCTPSNSMGIIQ